MTAPATAELRQLLEDHRATGSVYLPAVVEAALRCATPEQLAEALGGCGATNGAKRCALDAGHDGPCTSLDGVRWFSVAQVYR